MVALQTGSNWKRLVPIAVVSAAFAHNLWISWLKWGDLVIDSGRELDVARQLSLGRKLYTDVRYPFGPLAPCINGNLFHFFGNHAGILMAAGLICAALATVITYRLARRFISRSGATCVSVAFLYICAFAQLTPNGSFNFVLPYTQSATYGMTA